LAFVAGKGEANDVSITRRFELGEQQTIGRLVSNPFRHALVIDQEGGAIAAWVEYTGAPNNPRAGPQRLFAAYAPPGGAFGPPQLLDVADLTLSVPGLAVDAGGNAVAIWTRNAEIRVAFRPAGSEFGAHQTLSSAPSAGPQVAMNASGEAIAVWHESDGPGSGHFEAAFRPAGGSFGPGQALGAAGFGGASRLRAAINDAGETVVVWPRDTTGNDELYATITPPGASVGAPQLIASSPLIGAPFGLALGPGGDAAAAWSFREVYLAERPAGAPFGAQQLIAARSDGPFLTVDAGGNMLLVFDTFLGEDYGVFASYRPRGGEFGTPALISDPTASSAIAHADFGGVGRAAIVFRIATEGQRPSHVGLVRRRPDGTYTPQIAVSHTPGHAPVESLVGAAPNGEVVILWRHEDIYLPNQPAGEYLLQAVRGREAIIVRDRGAHLRAGAGCEAADGHTAVCTPDARRLLVVLGNRKDRAVVDAEVPAIIIAGQAKDVIDARNGVADRISCGRGKDTLDADAEDVVSRDCE
jgi:hypothetical protein